MSTRSCVKLEHPSCLYVTPLEDKAFFEFKLLFFPRYLLELNIKPGRSFGLKRPATEEFSVFSARLRDTINAYFDPSHKKNFKEKRFEVNLQVTDVSFDPVDCKPSDTLGDLFSEKRELKLRLGIKADSLKDVLMDVLFKPATVTAVRLDLLPFTGCPIVPAVTATNLDLGKTKFLWSISLNEATAEAQAEWPKPGSEGSVAHEGYVFTPGPGHRGHLVRLQVLPHDSEGRPGLPFGDPPHQLIVATNSGDAVAADTRPQRQLPFYGKFIMLPKPVAEAPPQLLIHKRLAEVAGRQKGVNEFRLVSYNLLASIYSETESGRTFFFRHCPPAYLAADYRFPLLHREVRAYAADVLCLQEVDAVHFERRLAALLATEGFEAVFLQKLLIEVPEGLAALPSAQKIKTFQRKGEGVAIFFRSDRFRLVREFKLDSLILHAELEVAAGREGVYGDLVVAYHALGEAAAAAGAEAEVPMYLCMRARAHGLVAALLECRRTGRLLLVANTHLYFHPRALPLRNIQCHIVRRFLFSVAKEVGQGEPVPIILAGDLNTQPDSEPYRSLCLGCDGEGDASTRPVLKAAVPLPDGVYTNIVPGFKANLDAVLFNAGPGATAASQEPLSVACAFSVPTEAEVLAEGRAAQPEYPPLIPDAEGGLTLPNSQFPSDHLALAVDFALKPSAAGN